MINQLPRAAFLSALLAPLALAQPPAFDRVVADAEQHVCVPVPTGWTVTWQEVKAHTDQAAHAQTQVVAFDVTAPGGSDRIDISAFVLNGGRRTPRLMVLATVETTKSDAKDGDIQVVDRPVPHLLWVPVGRPERKAAFVYRAVAGRILSFSFECAATDWAALSPQFFAIAAGASCDLPPWPAPLVGYRTVDVGGIEVAFGPDIDKKRQNDTANALRDIVRAFTKVHGAVPEVEGAKLSVVVHASPTSHGRLLPPGAELESTVLQHAERRLLTTPIGESGTSPRYTVVDCVMQLMLVALYPTDHAMWMHRAEASLVAMEDYLGAPLPAVPDGQLRDLRAIDMYFDELGASSNDPRHDACAKGYVAYFRLGPAKCKNAYKALLADLRTTLDVKGAVGRAFGSFDRAALRKDAREFLADKLEGVHQHAK